MVLVPSADVPNSQTSAGVTAVTPVTWPCCQRLATRQRAPSKCSRYRPYWLAAHTSELDVALASLMKLGRPAGRVAVAEASPFQSVATGALGPPGFVPPKAQA